ncbi:MAG: hypothetical protein ACOVNU_11725 [Candidatus Kapaibacteriota bacterium]
MKKAKVRTNEDAFKELLSKLNSVQIALLRERVLSVCKETANECKFGNSFLHPQLYIELNIEVKKYLGFEENE